MSLPKAYAWLADEKAPKMLVEAVKLHGTIELPGAADSPTIMGWAKECGLSRVYSHDSVPWCGLFMAVVAKRAGYEPVGEPLWALNWSKFGNKVDKPMLGDVMVKPRTGGNHVTMYVGEDATHYHCLGGNQSDSVNIVRIRKTDFKHFRRAPFRVGQPKEVRIVKLASTGKVGGSEA